MKMLSGFTRILVVTGNIFFVLWILYNGINEGFAGTLIEKLSYISLMVLLTLNSVLLMRKHKSTV
ncbi:MAG: hypothetical protein JSS91_07195 [Bacteroidetes bacterium]|nr:hypothetical protein [Bacteroidota bacterium]